MCTSQHLSAVSKTVQVGTTNQYLSHMSTPVSCIPNVISSWSCDQSINQECMSLLLKVIPRTTDLQISAKTAVTNMHIIHFKLSIDIIIGLPLGLPPFITPTYTVLVVLSLFMSSNRIQDVFLPQSLPDPFTSHFVQSAHSLHSSHHARLGSLHSPLLLLCQTPHLTAVQQRGHHRGIDYIQSVLCLHSSLLLSTHSFLQPYL